MTSVEPMGLQSDRRLLPPSEHGVELVVRSVVFCGSNRVTVFTVDLRVIPFSIIFFWNHGQRCKDTF